MRNPKIAEQGAGPAELELNGNAVPGFVDPSDRLDGSFEAGGAIDEEGSGWVPGGGDGGLRRGPAWFPCQESDQDQYGQE